MSFSAECSTVWVDVTESHRIEGDMEGFRGRPRFTITSEDEVVTLEFQPEMLRQFLDIAQSLTNQPA